MVNSLLHLRNHALSSANRSIQKRESVSTEQDVVEINQVLFRQLRAVAMKEQRRDMDVSKGVYLQLATKLFLDTIGTRLPILHIPRHRLETSPGLLE